MKILPIVAAVALALLALTATSPARGAAAQAGVCQTNPGPVDAADPSMIVDSPSSGDTVASPLTVTGQARTFEANVVLTLFDANGDEIASTNGLAAEGGVLSPFSIDITFSVSASTPACLWAYESSAQDGSPINVVQVELTLSAGTTGPGTGTGGGSSTGGPTGVLPALFATLALGGTLFGAALLARRRGV